MFDAKLGLFIVKTIDVLWFFLFFQDISCSDNYCKI